MAHCGVDVYIRKIHGTLVIKSALVVTSPVSDVQNKLSLPICLRILPYLDRTDSGSSARLLLRNSRAAFSN